MHARARARKAAEGDTAFLAYERLKSEKQRQDELAAARDKSAAIIIRMYRSMLRKRQVRRGLGSQWREWEW